MSLPVLVTLTGIISALVSSALTAFVTLRINALQQGQKRAENVEARRDASDTAKASMAAAEIAGAAELRQAQMRYIDQMEKRVTTLDKLVDEYHQNARKLEDQIRDLRDQVDQGDQARVKLAEQNARLISLFRRMWQRILELSQKPDATVADLLSGLGVIGSEMSAGLMAIGVESVSTAPVVETPAPLPPPASALGL